MSSSLFHNRAAVLHIDSISIASNGFFVRRGLVPALAWRLHDTTWPIGGTVSEAILQPLAQHLTGSHAGVPLPNHKILHLKFPVPVPRPSARSGQPFPDLQELFPCLQEGNMGGGITQLYHLVEALHPKEGSCRLQEGVELKGPMLPGNAVSGGLCDLDEDRVAPWVGVLQGPGARCAGKYSRREKKAKETALD